MVLSVRDKIKKGFSAQREVPQNDAAKAANEAASFVAAINSQNAEGIEATKAPKATKGAKPTKPTADKTKATQSNLADLIPEVLPTASQESQTDQQLQVQNEFSSFTQTIINDADLANPLEGLSQKQIKKLKRVDLLELLVAQGEEIENLRTQLQDANTKLQDRELTIAQAGSIAEASLKLNKIFQDAQAAADQYLLNVKRHAKELKVQPSEDEAPPKTYTATHAKDQVNYTQVRTGAHNVYVVSNNPRARKKVAK
jgi:hypothetical protein